MSFGGGGGGYAPSTRPATPEQRVAFNDMVSGKKNTKDQFIEKSVLVSDGNYYTGSNNASGANIQQRNPAWETRVVKNPDYVASDDNDTFATTTEVLPGGNLNVTTKRLPERQPAKRPQGAAAAGSTSLLSSASGSGLKSLLGE